MCLGWLYHHLWHLARAGTREAQCASWAQYDTALEQSPVARLLDHHSRMRWRGHFLRVAGFLRF